MGKYLQISLSSSVLLKLLLNAVFEIDIKISTLVKKVYKTTKCRSQIYRAHINLIVKTPFMAFRKTDISTYLAIPNKDLFPI